MHLKKKKKKKVLTVCIGDHDIDNNQCFTDYARCRCRRCLLDMPVRTGCIPKLVKGVKNTFDRLTGER